MGRLSKRTIQCRAARKQRDLLKQQQKLSSLTPAAGAATAGAAALSRAHSLSSNSSDDCSGGAAQQHTPEQQRQPRHPRVDLLRKLGMASLCKYQQAFGIDLELERPSRDELVAAIAAHFCSAEVVDESAVLISFVRALRRDSSSDNSC